MPFRTNKSKPLSIKGSPVPHENAVRKRYTLESVMALQQSVERGVVCEDVACFEPQVPDSAAGVFRRGLMICARAFHKLATGPMVRARKIQLAVKRRKKAQQTSGR